MTWSASSRTARSAKSSAAAARPNAPSASRTGAGSSRAANSRALTTRRPLQRSTDASSVSSLRSHRIRCIATVVDRSRTSPRPPGSRVERVMRRPSGPATEKQTRPTGFVAVPPPGPAMPVIPTPTSAPDARPRAVGERLGDLDRHRPDPSDQIRRDVRERRLRGVRVHDEAARHVVRRARQVRQAAGEQPARARFGRRDRPAAGAQQPGDLLVDRGAVGREQRVGVALADDRLEGLRRPPRPPARTGSPPRARRDAGTS